MIPEEFVAFSSGFEVGFLVWIKDDRPTMVKTDFAISKDDIRLDPGEYDPLRLPIPGSRVTLIFANPLYTERCEMGIIKGALKGVIGSLEIEPHDITWTLSFDVNKYPDRLVRRWMINANSRT
jgi:hypothetical protein